MQVKNRFDYDNGNLIWKHDRRASWGWNKKFVGKVAGTKMTRGYIKITFNGRQYMAHRLVWEWHNGKIPKHLEIDHINADTHDNRIENLQLLTPKQNMQRQNHMNAKGYKYDEKNKHRPYCASRTYKYFGTPCGAYMSYATAFLQGESNGDSR